MTKWRWPSPPRVVCGLLKRTAAPCPSAKPTPQPCPRPAAKRPPPPALDAAESTVAAPGLGRPDGLFVLADGTFLACAGHSIRILAPSGLAREGADRAGLGHERSA
jgi:hypothetical protein